MAAETTAEATKPVVEKQTNCLSCNKPLKKVRCYYRNGKFFCTKKCWKTMLAKAKEEKKG
jgi:hypothetical protein